MTKKAAVPWLSICLLLLGGNAAAQVWWNDDWNFRKELIIDPAQSDVDLSGGVSDMPVLLRLSAANFEFFGDLNPDGSDLRFVSGDGVTPLSFYVEHFDAASEIALIWVRVPAIAAAAPPQSIYMYYNNPTAVTASKAASVFAADTRLVYDFAEADGRFRDKTAYGNDPQGSTATYTEYSLIGGGAEFNGTDSMIVLPAAPWLPDSDGTGLTITLWIRPSVSGPNAAAILSKTAVDSGELMFKLSLEDGIPAATFMGDAGPETLVAAGSATNADEWTHLAFVSDGSASTLYVDGQVAAQGAAMGPVSEGEWRLGDTFAGIVDQLVFRTGQPSAAQVALASRAEAPFSNVVYGGQDAQKEGIAGGGESYFVVTLRNVTVDGWVVIAILGVMAVISWAVMYMKGTLLSGIERQNARFLTEYSKLTGDPLALDRDAPELDMMEQETLLASALEDAASYHPSTLFPLYHVGAIEVRKRLDARSPAAGSQRAGLSAETIGAIRASVDAAHVRQRQKLNRLMVLLTIAISGGPFLGLLGTVVGVMITFAAIAASGDVNVNSIAPGIAAALVATVAGLVVAIPALFGYNWLGSRIKDIDANTQVFGDEFVNKIAEHYT